MQDYTIWTAIGYEELSGKLAYGRDVVLGRKEVIDKRPENCVEIHDVEEEKRAVCSCL